MVLFPSLLSFAWLSVFGGTALHLELEGIVDLGTAVNDDVATALFEMLGAFPLAGLTSVIGVVLVVSYFVTSSDSGSLVVDHLTSGGKLDSPRLQRVCWALLQGLLAAVLLVGGGLGALQTAAVAAGLPFAVVLLLLCWSLHKACHEELDLLESHYDAEVFRSQHSTLLEQVSDGEVPE